MRYRNELVQENDPSKFQERLELLGAAGFRVVWANFERGEVARQSVMDPGEIITQPLFQAIMEKAE